MNQFSSGEWTTLWARTGPTDPTGDVIADLADEELRCLIDDLSGERLTLDD